MVHAADEPHHTRDTRDDASRLGARLLGRVDELGVALANTVRDRVEFYRDSALVSPEALRTSCIAHLKYVFLALSGDTTLELSAAEATGRHRAELGVPLPEVLAAYRVGLRRIWDLVGAEANATGVSKKVLQDITSHAVVAHDLFAQAAATAFHAEMNQQILDQEQRRIALLDALLVGHVTEQQTLWETADLVGLPTIGPYVVIAAHVADVGTPALPRVAERLSSRGIQSAWLLRHDFHIGVAALRESTHHDHLIAVLSQFASSPVGVSPPYNELAKTAEALRLARIASLSATTGSRVVVFDEAPLAVAAVSAPEVMTLLAQRILGPLDSMHGVDRNTLLDTLIAWVDAGGSTTGAATSLYLHPNTVRQRLNKVEKLTARSLTNPSDIAEIRLALEIVKRLPTPAPR
ncbi:PucR family transcriptional regulator [Williamsia sterculiae]|uniref:PucR C-terminal helix-turn-helix domain-containing protein n=1 Tax=Williamsia sterculiae TaxID=1344003 RepID=A0A1N7HFD5_9NOCA|nr:PucR family transcriptional regulator [Williamsia sterculiae]SIS23390.1 PucR C-terminal helix-turn-helix domain-containing protein [Williamsia sterculiae]